MNGGNPRPWTVSNSQNLRIERSPTSAGRKAKEIAVATTIQVRTSGMVAYSAP